MPRCRVVKRPGHGQVDRAEHLTEVLTCTARDLLTYLERRTSRGDAPDLLAETMMTAWRRLPVVPVETVDARMWLFGIARNVLKNADRGARRRLRLADRLRELRQDSDVTAPAADTGSDVRDAIDRLAPELGELVRLVHWEGFSLVQSAEILAIPASTARGRYQRAKVELRQMLGTPAGASVERTS